MRTRTGTGTSAAGSMHQILGISSSALVDSATTSSRTATTRTRSVKIAEVGSLLMTSHGGGGRAPVLGAPAKCACAGVLAALGSLCGKLGGTLSAESVLESLGGVTSIVHDPTSTRIQWIAWAVRIMLYAALFAVSSPPIPFIASNLPSLYVLLLISSGLSAAQLRMTMWNDGQTPIIEHSVSEDLFTAVRHYNEQCNAGMMSLQLQSMRTLPSLQATVINTSSNLASTVCKPGDAFP